MSISIVTAHRTLKGRVARGTVSALAALSITFGALPASSLGADWATGPSRPAIIQSQAIPNAHRPTVAQPRVPPDSKLDYRAMQGHVIDRLYDDLMHWTPPWCSPASC
jgi:hypothetical protein